MKRILIGCERSGIVREAFRKLGYNAWSCDIEPADDGSEYHFQCDIFEIYLERWDMMIFFPECKYLTVTANRVFKCNPERWQKRLDAVNFVWKLWNAPIKKIAFENPKGVLSSYIGQPDQWVQPYEFGHPDSKLTGLWLKNLPLLEKEPDLKVDPEWIYPKSGSGKRMSKRHAMNPSTNNKNNAVLRAKTYQGIADAMAKQWKP